MSPRRISEYWAALAAFLLGVCLFGGLGAIGLIGPDEPRYVSIARAMARSGDWITPRLWGHPWFQKPILYYWSAAASFHLFGVSERVARLPNALSALVGALLLCWAARSLYGIRAALLTLILFPTTIGLFAFAHAATPDMQLSMSVGAAMVAALLSLHWPDHDQARPRGRRRVWLALVGVFLGFGVLAKGPVSIILAGGSVLLWALLTRRWRDAIRFLRWEPVAAFAVVALPWYVACSLVNPGFPHAFLWYQNFQRYLTPVFQHVQPWWFFFPVLALGLLPWTPLLLATARDGWRLYHERRTSRSPAFFVACWAAFPLLFFSFSHSKLPGYILPAIPALIFLLARTLDGIQAVREGDSAAPEDWLGRCAAALVGLTLILLAVTAGHWLRRLPHSWDIAHHSVILGFLVATIIVGVMVAVISLTGRPRGAVAGSALWMSMLVAAVSWFFLPQVGPYLSARDAALAANSVVKPKGAPVEVYKISRDWAYGLDYYFGHRLPEWAPKETHLVWVYTTPKGLATIEGIRLRPSLAVTLPSGLVLARVTKAVPLPRGVPRLPRP